MPARTLPTRISRLTAARGSPLVCGSEVTLSEPLGQPDGAEPQEQTWGSWLGSSVRASVSKVTTVAGGAATAVGSAAGGAVGAVSSKVSEWRGAGDGLRVGAEGAPAAAEGDADAAGAEQQGAGVLGAVKSGVGKVVSGAGQVVSGAGQAVTKTGAAVSEAVGTREAREQLKEQVKDKAKAAAAGTATVVGNTATKVTDVVGSTAHAVGDAVGSREGREHFKETVKDKAKAAASTTATVVGNTATKVTDAVGTTASKVGESASAVKDKAVEVGGAAVTKVGDTAAAVGSRAAEAYADAKESHPRAAAMVTTVAGKVEEIGRTAVASAAVAGEKVAGTATEVGSRVGNAVKQKVAKIGGGGGDDAGAEEEEVVHLEALLAQGPGASVSAELEASSVASRQRLRELREATDELSRTQLEGDLQYLHTIFHEATVEPPAGSGAPPTPPLPSAVAPSYGDAASAAATQRDDVAEQLSKCLKRVTAQLGELSAPRPDGAPPPTAQEIQLSLYSRRAAFGSSTVCVAGVSEASVLGLAEFCGRALACLLTLEHSLQRMAQAARLGCANDESPDPSLSAGGLVTGVAAALLAELSSVRDAYQAAALTASTAALEGAAEVSGELRVAKEQLEGAREAFASGLEIDYGTVRMRLIEAIHFLLPICALLAPSSKQATPARC